MEYEPKMHVLLSDVYPCYLTVPEQIEWHRYVVGQACFRRLIDARAGYDASLARQSATTENRALDVRGQRAALSGAKNEVFERADSWFQELVRRRAILKEKVDDR